MATYTPQEFTPKIAYISVGSPFTMFPFILVEIADSWVGNLTDRDNIQVTQSVKDQIRAISDEYPVALSPGGTSAQFDASSFASHSYPISSTEGNVSLQVNKFGSPPVYCIQYVLTITINSFDYTWRFYGNRSSGRVAVPVIFASTNYVIHDSGFVLDLHFGSGINSYTNVLDSNGMATGITAGVPFTYQESTTVASPRLLDRSSIPIVTPDPSRDDPDPYEEAGGGEGDLPGGEIIGLPAEPTLSPIDAGLFSLYSPTAAQMRNLADFLWTDFGGAGTTVEQVLEEVVEALKRSVSNPLNSMLGLSIIASQGLSKGSDSSVRVGFWNTGVSMTTITKQYFTVDCGSLSFSPVCGNTFLDYAPYSKFMIYLPYVGMRLLDANDVVGHTISIRYRGDCVSGALTCYVIRDGSVIQEHTGSCALNIPLTADSWAESISAVGRIISGSVSGATRGGAAGAAAGAVRGAASVATNPSAFSSQVAHTGAVSGAAGHLGSQKPFILREAVRFHSTDGFNSIIGYPSYYYRKLGDCRGYTQCLEVHLNHTPCTGVELQEIEELLKKGVII